MKLYRHLVALLCLGLFCSVGMPSVWSHTFAANSAPQNWTVAQQLVKQGRAEYEAGHFTRAAASLQVAVEAFKKVGDQRGAAVTLTNLGRVQLVLAQPEAALKSWQEAADLYQTLGDGSSTIRSKIYQAQALQELGLYVHACEKVVQALDVEQLLCDNSTDRVVQQTIQTLQQLPASIQFISLYSLGNILRQLGRLEESRLFLEAGLDAVPSMKDRSEVLLSLGNTFRALGDRDRGRNDPETNYKGMPWQLKTRMQADTAKSYYRQANEFYQQAIGNDPLSKTYLKVQIDRLSLFLETENRPAAEGLWAEMEQSDLLKTLTSLPKSRNAVYAQIHLAKNWAYLQQLTGNTLDWEPIVDLLNLTIRNARELQDPRTLSYALGNLGGLYEYLSSRPENVRTLQWQSLAQQLTQEALFLAQPGEAVDIAYQWQWQLGRLLEAQGDREGAIAAYESAIRSLEAVRNDLLALDSEVQFSFRDDVEPLYRRLVDLLLISDGQHRPDETQLQKSLRYIDALQLAELENLVGRQLARNAQASVAEVDPTAAIVRPILLEDQLAVLYKLPHQSWRFYTISVSSSTVSSTLDTLRHNLELPYTSLEFATYSRTVYDWLIRPLEDGLMTNNVETLVFVPDGPFQQIPLAVLHDGQQYLIERYAVAFSPRLKRFDPKPLQRKKLRILVAGSSDPLMVGEKQFPALPHVEGELHQILKHIPATKILLNSDFTKKNLEEQLRSGAFRMVHLATHGRFSSDPRENFILTGDTLITMDELEKILQSRNRRDPLELLVLSACETATGDRRATLGLAGVAVRAGSHSAIAPLWAVNDASTSILMAYFYKELAESPISKAEAMRRAQVMLLKKSGYSSPFFWAPHVLVGNWL